MSMNAACAEPVYEASSDDSSSLNRKSMSLNAQAWKEKWRNQQTNKRKSRDLPALMTMPTANMKREPRRELRKRLREELTIVQGLYSRLEERASQLRRHSEAAGVYPTLSDAQFSGNNAKATVCKEATSSSSRPLMGPGFKPAPSSGNGKDKKGKPVKKNLYFLSHCRNVLKKLMGHKDGWIFNKPVDAVKLGLTDYHVFIKKPMDLGTIKGKLDKKRYSSPEQFANDVRLTFDNAMTYNPPGNEVHQMADELLHVFEEDWNIVSKDLGKQNIGKSQTVLPECPREMVENPRIQHPVKNPKPQPLSAKNNATLDTLPKTPKSNPKPKPKPKPKAPPAKPKPVPTPIVEPTRKRDMTYEEKANLVTSLQSLPVMQDEIIQLLKARNPNLSQNEDEIELDIESFDNDTLWELDEFVKKCAKNLEKEHATAEVLNQSSLNPGEQGLKKQTGDVSKSKPAQENNASANRLSSSGSSSSGSGSSSDTGSDSSTSSDSDSGGTGKRQ